MKRRRLLATGNSSRTAADADPDSDKRLAAVDAAAIVAVEVAAVVHAAVAAVEWISAAAVPAEENTL